MMSLKTFPFLLICVISTVHVHVVIGDHHNDHLFELVKDDSSQDFAQHRTLRQTKRSLHFYALGDVPYLPREWRALPSQIGALNPYADFAMHVGDLKKRSTTCVENSYTYFRNIMSESLVPVLITIGDNDVVECADSNAAYEIWKSTFQNFEDRWSKPFDVFRQEERPENFALEHNNVFVIGLHIIHASFEEDPWLHNVVNDTVAWLQAHEENVKQAKAVVMFAHTFPSHPKYHAVRHAIVSLVDSSPDTPMIYIQGEKHHFVADNPIEHADNFLRVVVDKGGIADPLEVLVDPEAEVPFKLKRRSLLSSSS